MKKTILPLLGLLCICLSATAQFEKGQALLGGNLSLGTFNSTDISNSGTNTKGRTLYINPTIGFFSNDKTLYSFGVIYGYNSAENVVNLTGGVQKNVGNSYGLNFSKQRFMSIAKNFYFVMGGSISGMYNDTKLSYSQNFAYQTDKSGEISLGLQPGVSYKLSKKILFDLYIPNIFSASYTTGTHHNITTNGDAKTTYNSFSLATNLNSNLLNNLTFGIRFLLGKKS